MFFDELSPKVQEMAGVDQMSMRSPKIFIMADDDLEVILLGGRHSFTRVEGPGLKTTCG